jgi:hypothetical protein
MLHTGARWFDLPYPCQSVCQRHAHTLTPRRIVSLREQHVHHSYVPQINAACQLLWIIPQKPTTVADWMKNHHKCLEEHRDNVREGRMVPHQAQTINTFQGANPMGRHNSLSWSEPRYMTHLVISHWSGLKVNCSKDGYVGSPSEQVKWSLHQEWSPTI